MVMSCCVKGCCNRTDGNVKLRWYSIPNIREKEGESMRILSDERRRLWLANINRKDVPSKYSKICSDHFVHGQPASMYDRSHPDWAPTLKLPTYTTSKSIKKQKQIETDCKSDGATEHASSSPAIQSQCAASTTPELKMDKRTTKYSSKNLCVVCGGEAKEPRLVQSTKMKYNIEELLSKYGGISVESGKICRYPCKNKLFDIHKKASSFYETCQRTHLKTKLQSKQMDEKSGMPTETGSTATKVVVPADEAENNTHWIVDQAFRKEQERLKIPFDPMQWTQLHVKHWINWAIQEFKLQGVDKDTFTMTGAELCDFSHADFIKFIPFDHGNIFWTHLELLRKCKFVATRMKLKPVTHVDETCQRTRLKTKLQSKQMDEKPISMLVKIEDSLETITISLSKDYEQQPSPSQAIQCQSDEQSDCEYDNDHVTSQGIKIDKIEDYIETVTISSSEDDEVQPSTSLAIKLQSDELSDCEDEDDHVTSQGIKRQSDELSDSEYNHKAKDRKTEENIEWNFDHPEGHDYSMSEKNYKEQLFFEGIKTLLKEYNTTELDVAEKRNLKRASKSGDIASLMEKVTSPGKIRKHIIGKCTIENEKKAATLKNRRYNASVLTQRSTEYLKNFNWFNVVSEFKRMFPDLLAQLLSMMLRKDSPELHTEIEKAIPKLGVIYGILMQGRYPELSLIQRLNSVLLFSSISDKSVYAILHEQGLCMSYSGSLYIMDKIDEECNDGVTD